MLKLVMNFFKVLGLGAIGLFIILILIVSCSKDEPEDTQYKAEETLSEPVEVEQPVVEEVVNNAVLTNLGAGTFTVGIDIPDGRYVISSKEPSGNLHINGQESYVNEILGTEQGFAINNVTATLVNGDKIEISGLSKVTFTPKK